MIGEYRLIRRMERLNHEWAKTVINETSDFVKGVLYGVGLAKQELYNEIRQNRKPFQDNREIVNRWHKARIFLAAKRALRQLKNGERTRAMATLEEIAKGENHRE